MVNVLMPEKQASPLFEVPEGAQLVTVEGDDFDRTISSILQSAVPGGFHINTALLPMDRRINHIKTIEFIIQKNRNVLLYSHGEVAETSDNRIDVWWKGEENGSFMALLAYIISTSDIKVKKSPDSIRIIRKLVKGENQVEAERQLRFLLDKARLEGNILVLPEDDKPIHETVQEHSADAYLILMGMPGERAEGIARLFSLDRFVFEKEIEKFESLPPLLFVKAHDVMTLFE